MTTTPEVCPKCGAAYSKTIVSTMFKCGSEQWPQIHGGPMDGKFEQSDHCEDRCERDELSGKLDLLLNECEIKNNMGHLRISTILAIINKEPAR